MSNTTTVASRFLRVWQLSGDKKKNIPPIVPLSQASIWRMSRTGDFPKPYAISPRVTAWKAEDVQAWIDSRTQTRA